MNEIIETIETRDTKEMAQEEREAFLFRREYAEAIDMLPDGMAGRIVSAMAEFVFDGVEPEFGDSIESAIWILMKPLLLHDLGVEMDSDESD